MIGTETLRPDLPSWRYSTLEFAMAVVVVVVVNTVEGDVGERAYVLPRSHTTYCMKCRTATGQKTTLDDKAFAPFESTSTVGALA